MTFADEQIAELVKGRSFADIGGLWGTTNEKISVALEAGAASATIIDIMPAGHELWNKFDDRLRERGHAGRYRSIVANLDDADGPTKHGTFEVVHSAGIIYHCPNPVLTMMRYRALTTKYLILGSMVVPERIKTASGEIDMSENATYFIPGLAGKKLEIFRKHFDSSGLKIANINGGAHKYMEREGLPHYGPWWWLWTIDTLAAMCEVVGFKVRSKELTWGGRSGHLVLEVASV